MATAALIPGTKGVLRGLRGARRFAWIVVGYNILVILWGALVRATGSGAGCGNHWPLCNGQIIPLSPTLHTLVEFTHRQMVSGAVLTLIVMVAWTFRATGRGASARTFAVLSAVLMVNEAFLGALLVKLGYVTGNQSLGRVIVLAVHLSNTLLLLAALSLTAVMLGLGLSRTELRERLRAAGSMLTLTLCGLAATLIVGVSGSLAALGDTLFPSATLRAAVAADFDAHSPWLLRLRGVHPLSALVAAVFVVWILLRAQEAGASIAVRFTAWMLALQFVLGIADVLLLAPVWMQILHLLGADLFWVSLVMVSTFAVLGLNRVPNQDLSRIGDAHHVESPA